MKILINGIIIAATIFTSCNGNKSDNSSNISNKAENNSQTDKMASVITKVSDSGNTLHVKEIVAPYLQLKNALARDNSSEASDAGIILETALKNFDRATLTDDQKKIFEELSADATEHAEHINQSKEDIKHQREHFEMLSKDIYDLVKAFGAGQVIYKEFCPMYNEGKGAYWLNETKEIQNPYYGKEMPTCGVVKEELN